MKGANLNQKLLLVARCMVRTRWPGLCLGAATFILMVGCQVLPVGMGNNTQGSEETLTLTVTTETSVVAPAETPSQSAPVPYADRTQPPTANPTATTEATPTPTTPPASETPAIPPDSPPKLGSFDVYLGAPNDSGLQALLWVNTSTGETATEIQIRADDQDIVRAGQYIYFYAPGTREPRRANTAGAIQTLTFAAPPFNAVSYQLMPSATGNFLAWLSVDSGNVFTISFAASDGTNVHQVGGDTLLPGETVRLLRVTNDGRRIFYERRPASVTHQTLFNARYDLYMLDVSSGQVLHLPGEPACGEAFVCDAHVSADGAYLVRTLPPRANTQLIIVTNLVSSANVARLSPIGIPPGAAYEIGYPFLTPGGELIYEVAYGALGLERYLWVWANLVTGEQRVLAELGTERHRPLGWASDGLTLLTTREPDVYDTWQINTETGAMRQIAGMLFLGHIVEPPPAP